VEDRNGISSIAEFKDKHLEKEFFNSEISNTIKYLRPLILAIGILYFLFIIPDYFLIKDFKTFTLILLNRSVLAILMAIFYYRLKYSIGCFVFSLWLTIYEVLFTASFLLIVFQYETPNFLIQSFGVMIIIMLIFLVTNRWICMVAASLFLTSSFFVLSYYVIKDVSIREFLSAVVYILLAIAINSISSWRIKYYQRIQYLISENLRLLSTTDSLTNIYNRLKFNEELQKSMHYSNRYKTELSLILFDIDDFKSVNDNYGHLIGDKVLVDLSTMVKKSIRKTDTLARWGGEEFVILLPNTNIERAWAVADKIKDKIDNNNFENIAQNITCSFGVTSYCGGEEDLSSLIHRIDNLLYKAKKAGKNTIVSDFNDSLNSNEQSNDNVFSS
jgi:diguanylate cyclase (GGDEF)-like protein